MTRLILVGFVVVLLLVAASAGATPEKGDGPTVIQSGYGSVWVGTGGGLVVQVDPRGKRIVRRIRVYGYVHGLVPAYGSLWVAASPAVLQRIDVETGRVRELWSREGWVGDSVAVAAGRLWTLDGEGHRLWRIDPGRNRISARVDLRGGEPLSLWSDGSRLWLSVNVDPKPPPAEDDLAHVRLVALDPTTGRPVGPAIDTAGWVSFAAGFGSLWASDPIAGRLTRLDSASGRILASASASAGFAPLAAFGSIWLPTGAGLLRLDPDSLAVTAKVPVAAASVTAGSGALWTLHNGDGSRGTVAKVDPRTGRVVGRPLPIVPNP